MKNKIKLIAGFSIGPVLAAIIGFITVPVVSHFINADQYGLASMFTILVNALTIVSLLGLDQAYIREYNEESDKGQLFINTLIIPMFLTIVTGILIIIFRNNFALWLFDDSSNTFPVVSLVICMPLIIIERFFLLKIRMQGKGLKYSLWSISPRLLNLIIVVLLLIFYKSSFESVIYANIISQTIISVLILLLEYKDLNIKKINFDIKMMKKLVKYGLPIFPATCMSWALSSMDIIFLRSFSNYTEVGYYSIALKVVSIVLVIQTAFTSLWAPVAYKWFKEKQPHKKYETVTSIVSFMMVVIFLGILSVRVLVPYLLSKSYYQTIFIIPFLLFYPVFYTISETITIGIGFSRKTYYNMFISFISLIVNLVLNYILVPMYGGIGAAFATGVSYLVFFWARTIISRKLWYNFPILRFVFISVEAFLLAIINSQSQSLLFVTIIDIVALLINILIFFDVIIYFVKKESKYIGLICYKTQQEQLSNLINCDNVKCAISFNEKEKKITKLLKVIKMIILCDCIYFGYGECSRYNLIRIFKFFSKKIVIHWIGGDILIARKSVKTVSKIQKYVDANLCCSELILKELIELGYAGKVIPILPHLENYELSNKPIEHAVLSYIPKGNEKFYGIDYIEYSAKKFPDITFYIIGNDNDTINLKNVKFLGRVPLNEMSNLYDKVSTLIRLPEHDGLSLMLIESLLKGKDVVYCYDFPYCHKASNYDELIGCLSKIFAKKPMVNIDGRNYILKTYNYNSIQSDLHKYLIKLID